MAKASRKASSKRKIGRGPRGLKGSPGRPGVPPAAISQLTNAVEKMQADAEIQFKRTAQLQVQLDATLRALDELGKKAGGQRKKR